MVFALLKENGDWIMWSKVSQVPASWKTRKLLLHPQQTICLVSFYYSIFIYGLCTYPFLFLCLVIESCDGSDGYVARYWRRYSPVPIGNL